MNNKQNALITYIIDNNDILKQTTFSFFNRKRLYIDSLKSIKIYGLYICYVTIPDVMTMYSFIAYKRWPWSKLEVMKNYNKDVYFIYDYLRNHKDAEKRYNNIINELI